MRRSMIPFMICLVQVLILAASLHGQASSVPSTSVPSMDQANQLYFAKNWSDAEHAFAAIAQADSANAVAWLRLGISRHKLEHFPQALEAFKHAENDPQIGSSVLYRESASLARMGRKAEAIAALDKAVNAGLTQPQLFEQDLDLAGLRDDPAYKKVIEKADTIARPCAHQPEFRQFDFWIGEWDVVTTQGNNPAGASSIQLILDQCVILENWTGGGTGKSFNHYDAHLKKWIQDWVDSSSNSVHFEGELENGVMSYFADSADGQGVPIKRHMQFFNLDKDHVRQFSQLSHDGGKTWATQYDFTYIRKK